MNESAFTGYALTTERFWFLFDTQRGRFIDTRNWSRKSDAEFFHSRLEPVLRDRLILLERETYLLGEWDRGTRVG